MRTEYSEDIAFEYSRKELRAAGKKQWGKATLYSILADFWYDMSRQLC